MLHAATGEIPGAVLRATRNWSDADWGAAVESLVERGWVDATGAFTDEGRATREAIESETDELAVVAYEPLGDDGCRRLRELARPRSKRIVDSGELGPMSSARS
ncbi:MAG: hypothetical protein U5R31_08825 [Acidimicrobiia bacterium]|nr:hypothetical protein [Acidimicrobiia bacterium]